MRVCVCERERERERERLKEREREREYIRERRKAGIVCENCLSLQVQCHKVHCWIMSQLSWQHKAIPSMSDAAAHFIFFFQGVWGVQEVWPSLTLSSWLQPHLPEKPLDSFGEQGTITAKELTVFLAGTWVHLCPMMIRKRRVCLQSFQKWFMVLETFGDLYPNDKATCPPPHISSWLAVYSQLWPLLWCLMVWRLTEWWHLVCFLIMVVLSVLYKVCDQLMLANLY